jgi:predicted RNase H-like nuclease (RuvC/YqgF family)
VADLTLHCPLCESAASRLDLALFDVTRLEAEVAALKAALTRQHDDFSRLRVELAEAQRTAEALGRFALGAGR